MLETEFIPLARQYMDTVFRAAYSHLRCRADADEPAGTGVCLQEV